MKPTRSGAQPSEADIIRSMMFCSHQELSPYTGDVVFVGFDTRNGPKFEHFVTAQVFLKRAESNPNFDGLQHGIIVSSAAGQIENRQGAFLAPGETLLGGWCSVYRKDRSIPEMSTLNLSAMDKGNDVWKSMPGVMIEKCSITAALRKAFPTQLGGMYMREEFDENIVDAHSAPTPVSDLAGLTKTMQTPSLNGPAHVRPGTVPGAAAAPVQPTATTATATATQATQATQNTPDPPKAPGPAVEPVKRKRGRPRKKPEAAKPTPSPAPEPAAEVEPPFEPSVPEPPPEPAVPESAPTAEAASTEGLTGEQAEIAALMQAALARAASENDVWDAFEDVCSAWEESHGGMPHSVLKAIEPLCDEYLRKFGANI